MSGIAYLKRIEGATNNLVICYASDTTATATAANYITLQASNINSIDGGGWSWQSNDCIMLSASDGLSWCSINATFTTLTAFGGVGAGDVTHSGTLIAGNLPKWSNTSGNLIDSGLAPSSTVSQLFAVTTPGSLTSGNIPFLNDANGTLNTGRAPTAATAGYKVVMSPGSLVAGNLIKLADVNGTIADQGVAMKSVAQAAVAGGAAAQTVTDAFCTSASNVICTWNDTTNAVSIQKAVAGNGSFVVTSSADPGASHLNYVIFK